MVRRRWRTEEGQAALELALVIPLLLLLLFAVTEMGRVGYAYITVNNAARAGARVASVGGNDQDILTTIQNSASFLNPTSLMVQISPGESVRQSGEDVTIEVEYPVQLIIPVIQGVIPNPVVVSSRLSMRLE
ncbi:TadE/TadG family type IV pilus assembly protein [Paradesulfitobacterium ferrireducens]|uniref:TadE/TadG family type IV pilus assembly protein n=1 Tax=Paradesulfitobacterium ferrireducens TaxID=2816476 RepID=UPI001A90C3A1|nr:TadE family protein [Paradesulfitobacterium ferrireducens]